MDKMRENILDWLVSSSDKGVSSEAMACALLGKENGSDFGNSPPSGPSDFNRCLKFIIHVPEAKAHMSKIASINKTWGKLVDKWDEVEQMFLDEVGLDWEKGRKLRAEKTYKLMKEIGC